MSLDCSGATEGLSLFFYDLSLWLWTASSSSSASVFLRSLLDRDAYFLNIDDLLLLFHYIVHNAKRLPVF
jgi:hypothetical protein